MIKSVRPERREIFQPATENGSGTVEDSQLFGVKEKHRM